MAAQNCEPIATYIAPLGGSVPIEIQRPEPDALLAVCGACGFEWDADHHFTSPSGTEPVIVYECQRCVAKNALEQLVIASNQRDEATQQLKALAGMNHLKREVEHLRPQNELLAKEANQLRDALRLLAIGYQDQTNGAELMGCRCCRGTWAVGAREEAHVRGCLADAP